MALALYCPQDCLWKSPISLSLNQLITRGKDGQILLPSLFSKGNVIAYTDLMAKLISHGCSRN